MLQDVTEIAGWFWAFWDILISMEDCPAKRILIVEDDMKLAGMIREFLEKNGFAVGHEDRGDMAVDRILENNPDLVILDIMLPGMDGLTVCRQVRPRYKGAILMLTAKGGEVDEIVGLEIGADDYMAKPVRSRLMLARIYTLLRRAGDYEGVPHLDKVKAGTVEVDNGRRRATINSNELALTDAEFDLLSYLVRRPGRILKRKQIYRELIGVEYDSVDRSIDIRISRLRKKLGEDGQKQQRIRSVRGTGYQFVVDP